MASGPGRRRVLVAVSGGVDSSVAAYLLSRQQSSLMGLYMSNWNHLDDDSATTTSHFSSCHEQDMKDAQKVCDVLDIPLHRASFAAEYWTGVFEPFLQELSGGQTPNPDVRCNSIVKFGAMKDYALQRFGVDTIATGHYARLWERDESQEHMPPQIVEVLERDSKLSEWLPQYGTDPTAPLLLAAADGSKDQSYFLSGVDGNAFRNVWFPLGNLYKRQHCNTQNANTRPSKSVRQLAEEAGLPTANKRDSMGICFVGTRNFGNFISQHVDQMPPGDFCNVDTGETVGRHEGFLSYTIGQGARIAGASQKWFVVSKDRQSNIVWVCAGTKHPALYSDELYVKSLHWIAGIEPLPLRQTGCMRLQCRTRHLQPLTPCDIVAPSASRSHWTIRFDRPVRAITPGQMAALYVGNGLVCLGGGPIVQRGPSFHEQGLTMPPSDVDSIFHNDSSKHQEIA